jgi:hypothetical protein
LFNLYNSGITLTKGVFIMSPIPTTSEYGKYMNQAATALEKSRNMSAPSTPAGVNFVNKASSLLLNIPFSSIPLSLGLGAFVGSYTNGKKVTTALNCLASHIFWKYVVPNTFGKVCWHPHSTNSANLVGLALAFATAYGLTYALNKRIYPTISDRVPYSAEIKEEAKTEAGFFANALPHLTPAALSLTPAVLFGLATILSQKD